jgi:glycosyltransferase involved in cell wall biosynthesis
MDTTVKPTLSVILPVYNGEQFIGKAIDSILAQTFREFELIIINDGSSDATPAILNGYDDPRIRVEHQKNRGIVASLNRAVELSTTDLIARHDADDISMPERFEKQIAYLQQHPNTVIVGSSITTIDMSDYEINKHMVLLDSPELKQELLVRSPFAHGAVMFRKSQYLQAGGYSQHEWPAEDYGLWVRLSAFGDFANIDEPLYSYRENSSGISALNNTKQHHATIEIQHNAWTNRSRLIPKDMLINAYVSTSIDHARIERISRNLTFGIRQSIMRGDIKTFAKLTQLILKEKLILKKSIRQLVMK